MIRRPTTDRRSALKLVAGTGASLALPGILTQTTAQGLDKFSYNTNWRAQAEHGGFYYALANGFYKEAGIDADIRMGGPQLNMSQILVGGVVDMVMSNSFEAINYARENLPFLVIGSIFQKDPQVLISHPGVGHDKVENLKGKPILIGGTSRTSFWLYLKAKYGFTDEQIRPYTFNIQPFVADKNAVQQGYLSSEPHAIEKQGGFKPTALLLSDHGWPPYSTTIVCMRDTLNNRRADVAAFVKASMQGWKDYLQRDPAAADGLIKKDNPAMSDELLAHGREMMLASGMVFGGEAARLGVGTMSDERFRKTYDMMVAMKLLDATKVDVKKTYTTEFVKNLRILP